MNDLAYVYDDEPDYELIGGEKIFMAAAAPNITHGTIVNRIASVLINYIDEKNIEAIVLGDADVYLSETDHFRPDLNVICDLSILKNGKKVYGAPDLVVEVLSESTMKNDIGPKKTAYERNGVKEYWIVDQWSKRIEVYHLIDGKYVLDDVYKTDSDKTEIKVSIFDDLTVDIYKVFKWYFN